MNKLKMDNGLVYVCSDNLTSRQKLVLEFAQENGKVDLTDLCRFYSTFESRKNAMMRLIILGYLKPLKVSGNGAPILAEFIQKKLDVYEWMVKEENEEELK